jgi:hypothetical protein
MADNEATINMTWRINIDVLLGPARCSIALGLTSAFLELQVTG